MKCTPVILRLDQGATVKFSYRHTSWGWLLGIWRKVDFPCKKVFVPQTPFLIQVLVSFGGRKIGGKIKRMQRGSAQEWTNHTLAVHERVDSRFLVLPDIESTITEITEYIYFSPLKPCREFTYKSD